MIACYCRCLPNNFRFPVRFVVRGKLEYNIRLHLLGREFIPELAEEHRLRQAIKAAAIQFPVATNTET